ncbi:hypothetical protein [Inhella inkyongensis]|nr:hypothetical protein [Inhella inkyongensis]
MFALFRSEWRRLRGVALAGLALHALPLLYLARLLNLPQQSQSLLTLFAVFYLLLGLLFGAWQAAAHRRGGAWLQLLHRPLAPWRVALALLGAGGSSLGLMVAGPLFLSLPLQSAWGRLVEAHHLGLCVYAALVALGGYLCGWAASLGPRGRSLPVLALPLLMLFQYQPLPWLLLPMVLFNGFALALVLDRFRPDTERRPRGFSLVLQGAALFWLVATLLGLLLSLGGQAALSLVGHHPSQEQTPENGFEAWRRLKLPAQIERLGHRLPEALAGQRPGVLRYPVRRMDQRHQPAAIHTLSWRAAELEAEVDFSHQHMLYRVQGARGKLLGWLGTDGLQPQPQARHAFSQPPLMHPAGVLEGRRLWIWDGAAKRLQPGLTLPLADGDIQDLHPVGARQLLVVSAWAVKLMQRAPEGGWATQWRHPLPQGAESIEALQWLHDESSGTLWLSLLEGRHMRAVPRRLQAWRIGAVGAQRLGVRTPEPDFPDWLVRADWVVAPLFTQLGEVLQSVQDRHFGKAHWQAADAWPQPATQRLAVGLSLLAAVGAALLARRRAAHWHWVWAALLLGPALLPVQGLLQTPTRRAWHLRTMPA